MHHPSENERSFVANACAIVTRMTVAEDVILYSLNNGTTDPT